MIDGGHHPPHVRSTRPVDPRVSWVARSGDGHVTGMRPAVSAGTALGHAGGEENLDVTLRVNGADQTMAVEPRRT
jgi:hypothetical protein